MGRIVAETRLGALREICFDLARNVEAHCATASFTEERAVPPGRTTGLLELGDLVVFEGTHFGLRLRLSARIVEFDRPNRFIDETVKSPFRSMRHVHEFHADGSSTIMIDKMEWVSPLGPLGKLADVLFVQNHLEKFLVRKQQAIKILAEDTERAAVR